MTTFGGSVDPVGLDELVVPAPGEFDPAFWAEPGDCWLPFPPEDVGDRPARDGEVLIPELGVGAVAGGELWWRRGGGLVVVVDGVVVVVEGTVVVVVDGTVVVEEVVEEVDVDVVVDASVR